MSWWHPSLRLSDLSEFRSFSKEKKELLVDWFSGVLWQREAKILFLGLDNAEKTILLHMLKDGDAAADEIACFIWQDERRGWQHVSTQYPTSEDLSIGSTRFEIHDYGGPRFARGVVRDYNVQVDAVVYVVDASDPRRLVESMRELRASLDDGLLRNVPFLILGNRSHRPHLSKDLYEYALLSSWEDLNAFDPIRFSEEFFRCVVKFRNLADLLDSPLESSRNVRPVKVFMYTSDCKKVCRKGFRWLSQYIT